MDNVPRPALGHTRMVVSNLPRGRPDSEHWAQKHRCPRDPTSDEPFYQTTLWSAVWPVVYVEDGAVLLLETEPGYDLLC
jgi:hypothetical protein